MIIYLQVKQLKISNKQVNMNICFYASINTGSINSVKLVKVKIIMIDRLLLLILLVGAILLKNRLLRILPLSKYFSYLIYYMHMISKC